MRSQQTEFAEFFQASWEPCLRAVVAVAGARPQAEDQVAEASSGPGKPPPDQSTLSITIDPAAIPAGTALSIGDFQLGPDQQQADLVLIDTSSSTCSSTPPGPDGPPGGTQIIFGGSGQAGS